VSHILYEVVGLVDAETIRYAPKWQRALRAVEALQDAVRRMRWQLR
jgi:excisionase family DNA binding protein